MMQFWKNGLAGPYRVKYAHAPWPRNSSLNIYPRLMKTYSHKKTCARIFIAVVFTIAPN